MSAYLKIIRPINLAMMLLTQVLFWFCLIEPINAIYYTSTQLQFWQVALLMLSTIAIAAGGYVINDYYDLPIDMVNKPEKVIVSNQIDDDSAFNYYIILTVLGNLAALTVAISLSNYKLILLPVLLSSMLWFYAQSLKHLFFIGNFVVSIASASVIFILIYYEINWQEIELKANQAREIILFGGGYMLFAFTVSMLRELVKDIQDRKGDEQFGCKTIPIVLGETKAKMVAVGWLLVIIFGIVYVQLGLVKGQQWLAFGYLVLCLQLPCLWLVFKLTTAKNKKEYARISTGIKAIMFFGIITMIYIGNLLSKYVQEIDSWL